MRREFVSESERRGREYGLALALDHYDEYPECAHCGAAQFSSKRNKRSGAHEWKWNCGLVISFDRSLGLDGFCSTFQQRSIQSIKHFHNQLVREHMDDAVFKLEGGRGG